MTEEIWISTIFGNFFSFSWKLNFHRNFTDIEFNDLERLMSSLTHVRLSPSILDTKAWYLFSSSLFSVKSFFITLFNISDLVPFYLAKFLWKSKVSSKVKIFV